MSSGPFGGESGGQPTEDELRAAYEAEIKKIRVEHVLLEHVVTLINLGMRRTGLAPGTEAERDREQVRLAIEAVRVLLPLVEQAAPAQAGPIRDAVSQLQLAFVRIGGQAPSPGEQPAAPDERAAAGTPPAAAGTPPASAGTPPAEAGTPPAEGSPPPPPSGEEPAPAQPEQGQPGPAQRSGRLWIPGQ